MVAEVARWSVTLGAVGAYGYSITAGRVDCIGIDCDLPGMLVGAET